MNDTPATILDFQELLNSFDLAADIVTKDYLYSLSEYEVCQLPDELQGIDIIENTRIFKFSRLIYDKNESTLEKLVTVFNAAYSSNATIITLIKGYTDHVDYYMGIVNKEQDDLIQKKSEVFKNVFNGNFPGSKIESLENVAMQELYDNIFKYDCITAVSGIASLRNDKEDDYEKYVQGMEHLIDSLQGKEYSIIIIADPVNHNELAQARNGYEQMYSQLSPYANVILNINDSDTTTISHTDTESLTKTIGDSVSLSQNYSETSGWSKSTSHSEGTTRSTAGAAICALLGVAAGIGVTAASGGAAAPATLPIIAASAVGGVSAAAGGLFGSKNKSDSNTDTQNQSSTNSAGKTETTQSSEATQHGISDSTSESTSHGRSTQISSENKTTTDIIEKIDKNLERIIECEAYGAFNCAAYVISPDPETCEIAASGYNALMRGDNSAWQASYINTWNEYKNKEIKEYLKLFTHPLFSRNNTSLSPAILVNSNELAVHMGIPKKSISGLPVLECVPFGRNISSYHSITLDLPLGKIYHMHHTEESDVSLSSKDLTAHTFVTGSTGSGKSNTIYKMLYESCFKSNKKFLVIESAKGEYKNIFGGYDSVSVYGTNIRKSALLKINPFVFPDDDITVAEHIDRLIEIFNACWPMYAAMPAVLKEAIEAAYVSCGWSITRSVCIEPKRFPTFATLLSKLPDIINTSAYSKDTKSDYIGALVTRVKSLTNGINGMIFCADEDNITDEQLFDNNVIIDLSRVGSSETKALIMGMLVIKLQEYRMLQASQGTLMNSDLRHITVLEEAHNLLRRTSSEQSQESSNLQGKSVEMLANAIAEMRTYGEGFIIADQSPGLLDMSVIRNTNTKIIMHLPDESDRELAGKAAGLNDEQIKELAKLDVGVAAVYQNHWIEPVLCKVDEFTDDKICPLNYNSDDNLFVAPERNEFFKYIITGCNGQLELTDEEVDKLKRWIDRLPDSIIVAKELFYNIVNKNSVSSEDCKRAIYCVVGGKSILNTNESNFNAFVEQQIIEKLVVSESIAMELRKIICNYACNIVNSSSERYNIISGGVK